MSGADRKASLSSLESFSSYSCTACRSVSSIAGAESVGNWRFTGCAPVASVGLAGDWLEVGREVVGVNLLGCPQCGGELFKRFLLVDIPFIMLIVEFHYFTEQIRTFESWRVCGYLRCVWHI